MRPPLNAFATPPPVDLAVGAALLPAPGLDGSHHQPSAYSLPVKPAVPPELELAAGLLISSALVGVLAVVAGELADHALLQLFMSVSPVLTGIWLAVSPDHSSRIAASFTAVSCTPMNLALADASDGGPAVLGSILALPVLALLWMAAPARNYFHELAQYQCATRTAIQR